MTVTSDYIEAISQYRLGRDYTQSQLDTILTISISRIGDLATGLTESVLDEAVALMACHYISRAVGKAGLQRERMGEYECQIKSKSGSVWIDELNRLLSTFTRSTVPGRGVDRSDAYDSGKFRISISPTSTLFDTADKYASTDEDRKKWYE